ARDDARAAKHKAAELLRDLPQLAGLGITKVGKRYAVKLNLTAEAEIELPDEIDGVPLKVEVVGKIRPY
ncbi:MAG TPA: hypothetical protein VF698_00885, partial [Thermoanaerobaculia bacterium]